jgi:hypothetical protein
MLHKLCAGAGGEKGDMEPAGDSGGVNPIKRAKLDWLECARCGAKIQNPVEASLRKHTYNLCTKQGLQSYRMIQRMMAD